MKVFIKKKVVEEIHHSNSITKTVKLYVLEGEYRDNPDKYLDIESEIDLDLSKLYAAYEQKHNKS